MKLTEKLLYKLIEEAITKSRAWTKVRGIIETAVRRAVKRHPGFELHTQIAMAIDPKHSKWMLSIEREDSPGQEILIMRVQQGTVVRFLPSHDSGNHPGGDLLIQDIYDEAIGGARQPKLDNLIEDMLKDWEGAL